MPVRCAFGEHKDEIKQTVVKGGTAVACRIAELESRSPKNSVDPSQDQVCMPPSIELRAKQSFALTPRLQQSVRLLQLSSLEFQWPSFPMDEEGSSRGSRLGFKGEICKEENRGNEEYWKDASHVSCLALLSNMSDRPDIAGGCSKSGFLALPHSPPSPPRGECILNDGEAATGERV